MQSIFVWRKMKTMKRWIFALIFIGLTMPLAYGQSQDRVLELLVKPDKKAYEPKQDMTLTFVFRNSGGQDLSFCRYNLKEKLLRRRIKFTNEKGEVFSVSDKSPLKMPEVTDHDFVLLHPEEEYSVEIDLSTAFPPDSSLAFENQGTTNEIPEGVYQLTVVYENQTNFCIQSSEAKYGLPEKTFVEKAWIGSLASKPVTVTVAARANNVTEVKALSLIKDYVRDNAVYVHELDHPQQVDEQSDAWVFKYKYESKSMAASPQPYRVFRVDKETKEVDELRSL